MTILLNNSPTLSIINGQYFLSIPQYGLYDYALPPVNSLRYRNFLRCNSFIMFRRHLLWALGTNTSNTSKMAKNSWSTSSNEFKEFYREYTKNVFNARINRDIVIKTKQKKKFRKLET